MTENKTGILLIDAPTSTGKTLYIRSLGAAPVNTLTSEQLVDTLLQSGKEELSLEETAASLDGIRFFENMESLRGRSATQTLTAQLVNILASDRLVILTGIDFRQNLPVFLENLDPYQHWLYTDNVGQSHPVDISPYAAEQDTGSGT